MQFQVNTDDHIQGREALAAQVEAKVARELGPFREHISRVAIHLSDTNSGKAGSHDKRCLIEARLNGRSPAVASHQAPTIDDAVRGAVDKLGRALESTLGRVQDRKGGESIRRDAQS